jgi:hypothetical protein
MKPKKSKEVQSSASKFGQLIGQAFDSQVYRLIERHLQENHPEYILLSPSDGRKLTRLEMMGGTMRQMDNVIVPVNSQEPVALFETKWLKDARHHNDKGAWILQLREIRKRYSTIRGIVANLAGYWTESVGVMFEQEGQIRMVLVATDEEIYQTLQPHLDAYCEQHQLAPLPLKASELRLRLPRPGDLASFLNHMIQTSILESLATSWFDFPRRTDSLGHILTGGDLIRQVMDEFLAPLPTHPAVTRFEIALHISTGNLIYKEFVDIEEALQFIQLYHRNPDAILRVITPRPHQDSNS